jgi:hypothetical protein
MTACPRLPRPMLLVPLLLAACGDGGGGPGIDDEAARIASRFDALADSIGAGGHEPTSEALRHAADLVRLTGGATPVTLTIDGARRDFLAVAEQLDFPLVVCAWPADSGSTGGGTPPDGGGTPPDSGGSGGGGSGGGECTESGTQSMRTLIAWEPEEMAEVVRIVADTGVTPAQEEVPDVMTGLPTYAGSDSAVGGAPVSYPGFGGEYMVRGVGSWWATEGTQANGLEAEGGACTDDRVTFGWAEMSCDAVSLRFEFSMEVEAATWEYLAGGERSPSDASGSHQISLASTVVEGVRLAVLAWTPPEPEPLPPPPPVDTVTTLDLDVSFEATEAGGLVTLRFRIANGAPGPVTFDFPSGQRFDFAAIAPSGEVRWRWSADKSFIQAFGSITLQPGDALEYEARWNPNGVTGDLVLEATLTSLNLPIVRSAGLTL